jgi:hypothetical protein
MRSSRAVLALAVVLPLLSAAHAVAAPARSKLLLNTTGKTVIRKVVLGNDETIAVISRSGTAAVNDPYGMPAGLIPDFVAVTHDHHLDKAYAEQTKGVKSNMQQPGSWTVGDLAITAVAGSHSVAPVRKERPDIVTYLYEVDGLRIAFFACNGQQQLEPQQLAALGKVDVALITLENGAGLSTAHARDLMKQLAPRVIVPLSHHAGDMEYNMDLMAELVGGKYDTVEGELALDPADLKGKPLRMIHILPTLAP